MKPKYRVKNSCGSSVRNSKLLLTFAVQEGSLPDVITGLRCMSHHRGRFTAHWHDAVTEIGNSGSVSSRSGNNFASVKYLFRYSWLFNDAVSCKDCVASNGRILHDVLYVCIRVGHKAGPCTATFNDLLCF
jgi:hypothetical protein